MKSTEYLWLVLLIVGASCGTARAPHGSVPARQNLKTDAYGGWIGVTDSSQTIIQGELIALSDDSLFVLDKNGFQSVAKSDVSSARLIIYRTSQGGYAAWTFLGSLFTLTTGTFAVVTLPAMLISGIVTTTKEARRINYVDYPPSKWELIGNYARFPQGLPPGLDRSGLRPRSNPPAK